MSLAPGAVSRGEGESKTLEFYDLTTETLIWKVPDPFLNNPLSMSEDGRRYARADFAGVIVWEPFEKRRLVVEPAPPDVNLTEHNDMPGTPRFAAGGHALCVPQHGSVRVVEIDRSAPPGSVAICVIDDERATLVDVPLQGDYLPVPGVQSKNVAVIPTQLSEDGSLLALIEKANTTEVVEKVSYRIRVVQVASQESLLTVDLGKYSVWATSLTLDLNEDSNSLEVTIGGAQLRIDLTTGQIRR